MCKFVGMFSYPLDMVARAMLSAVSIATYDVNVAKYEEHSFTPNPELKQLRSNDIQDAKRCQTVLHFVVKLPFPMNQPRRYLNATSIEYNATKQQIIMIHKPCILPDKPLTSNWLEMKSFCAYILTKVDDNTTLMNQIHM